MTFSLKVAIAVLCNVAVIPACLMQAWTPANYPSIKEWPTGIIGQGPDRKYVDEFKWQWLNYWYANSEDGVSGQQAYIWENGQLVPYMSGSNPIWRAICWNLRNNANNVKRPLRGDSLSTPWVPNASAH